MCNLKLNASSKLSLSNRKRISEYSVRDTTLDVQCLGSGLLCGDLDTHLIGKTPTCNTTVLISRKSLDTKEGERDVSVYMLLLVAQWWVTLWTALCQETVCLLFYLLYIISAKSIHIVVKVVFIFVCASLRFGNTDLLLHANKAQQI